MSCSLGNGISIACQDWANTKAAYRFLSNKRVSEDRILAGHFESTRARFTATNEPTLILHDTTEFSFKRQDQASIGLLKKLPIQNALGRRATTCGILMHSSLVVTASGLPLGLGAVKFWTRDKFKGTDALKRKINPTRVPIEKKESIRWLENLRFSTELLGEPERCIHVGDRESDIYELFCLAKELKTHFIFRTCVDRVANDGTQLVSDVMSQTPVKGSYCIPVTSKNGEHREAQLEIKFTSVVVQPPGYKKRAYPEIRLTAIEARERSSSKHIEPIVWKLLTTLPIQSLGSAIETINLYALRWRIETFHKILKSGCRAEQSRLRSAERLVNLLAIFCVLSWRIFWITMLHRETPAARASAAFTEAEIEILTRLMKASGKYHRRVARVDDCILQVAKLGGYLARASDPPPGNLVIWRGMSRLSDIQAGFTLHSNSYG
jgi:hypothetical protein